ncbi:hypothetical protein FOMG_03792 [Fusarium oxysporum f. sp. melonis 26406]|uniref:Uncharacterized protein n=1 Tax=Fusarium oxysporum f. sp. melonis 26406 TaxID=1089452 RepID=X0ANK6_FUSOX|nr:hypothetical protein FOMG_03792 [Fusarium oxysporum f. sp. melonis 26406]
MARDSQIAADRGGGDCVELKLNLRTGVLYRTWSPSGPRLVGRDNGTPQGEGPE